MSLPAVGVGMDLDQRVVRRHVAKLEAAGWLAREPWIWGEGSVVWLTGAGIESAGLGGVRAVKSPPGATTLAHGVLVGWSAARVEHRGRVWNEDGERWLAMLPRRVDYYAREWELSPVAVADGGAMSCCVFCHGRAGRDVVLKIPADARAGRREAVASERWAATGASPEVIMRSPSSGVYLMDRIQPGTTAPLAGDPQEAVHYRALLTRMQDPPLPKLPRVRERIDALAHLRLDWARERFSDDAYASFRALPLVAERVLAQLVATTPNPSALHGDLQGKNVLLGVDGEYVAIDAFLAVGDVSAEAALWAVIQANDVPIDRRLADLAADPLLNLERLRAWAFVYAVAEYRLYVLSFACRMRDFVRAYAPAHGYTAPV